MMPSLIYPVVTNKTKQNIFDFLKNNPEFDYPILDISNCLNMNFYLVKSSIYEMVHQDKTVMKIRKFGNSTSYQLVTWMNKLRKKEMDNFRE